jgi:hypothetical protein
LSGASYRFCIAFVAVIGFRAARKSALLAAPGVIDAPIAL